MQMTGICRSVGCLAGSSRTFHPVQDRHHQIEQNGVGLVQTHSLQRIGAVVRGHHVVGLVIQQRRQEVSGIWAVFGDQYGWGRRADGLSHRP